MKKYFYDFTVSCFIAGALEDLAGVFFSLPAQGLCRAKNYQKLRIIITQKTEKSEKY